MAPSPLGFFRILASVVVFATLLSLAAPSWAAPPAQDATPTAEAAGEEATPAPTAAPTAIPAGTATLTGVDTSRFPELNAYLLVNDLKGARIGALTASAIELQENGAPVRGLTVSETDVGVQVVFVLDANDAFSARDANGVTRLEYITQALNTFATEAPRLKPGLDLVTILAPEQPILERADNPALIAQAMGRYESTFGGAADPFPLLHQALSYALDVVPRPAMRRHIVYFSNGWNRFDVEAGVTEVASRAAGGGVTIHTVFVGPIGADNTLGSQNLQKLAEAAGGERLIFSGPEALAPLFQLLSDRGRQYQLNYRSTLAATGQHQLTAQVRLPGSAALISSPVVFPLRIEAPKISLAGVPASVVRVAASHDADLAAAEPAVLDVPLVVDFPDGHARGVRLAQLLVDGQPVVTQTNPSALNNLAWPLAAYVEAGEHQLQARVIDELGLAAESEPVLVTISMQVPAAPPSPPLLEQVNSNWPLLAVALTGLGLAAAVGLGLWWWLRRRQVLAEALAEAAALEATVAARPVVRRVKKVANGAAPPAEPEATVPRPAARLTLPHVSLPALRWPNRAPALQPARGLCYFEVVEAGGGGAARPDIDLTAPHLTLGRDAAVADTIFHDRSVSRLHARVLVNEQGVTIVDQGSTSGTWVNYSPVQGEAGCTLRHGDLVNLGRVQLRFLRRDAPPPNGNGARVIQAPPAGPGLAPPAIAGHLPTPGATDAGPRNKAGS